MDRGEVFEDPLVAHLTDVHLTDVHLTDVHLTDVALPASLTGGGNIG